MKTLEWEGVTWTLVKHIHNPGTPIECDGCERPVEYRSLYHGSDGNHAYWCTECVAEVEADQGR